MRELDSALFKGICLVFSAVLLILCLLSSVRLAGLSQTMAEEERRQSQAKQENQRLTIVLEQRVNLEQIERYAVDRLGMQPPSAGQIYHIQLAPEG